MSTSQQRERLSLPPVLLPSAAASWPSRKVCKVCGESIATPAVKCIHCGSYQVWWRGILGLSNTFLALLIALISVTTSLLPVLKNSFASKNSDLQFSYQGANEYAITVFASNLGIRPGSVRSATMKVPKVNNIEFFLQPFENNTQLPPVVIDPGKSLLVNFGNGHHNDSATLISFDPKDQCDFKIFHTDFLGNPKSKPLDIKCADVAGFISKAQ
jgi:hypothetical protein